MARQTQLSKEQTLHLAKLANLVLTEEEIKTYGKQLSDILSYIQQLNEVDTSAVRSTSHTVGTQNVMREDVVDPDRSFKTLPHFHIKEKNGKKYFIVTRIM